MNADVTQRRSGIYGTAQTVLLLGYAAAYFLDPGAPLFAIRWLGVAGTAACAAGLAMMLLAITTLRDVIQVAPEPRADGHLVTRGVYGRFRHPIYTGITIVLIGLVLRRPTLLVAVATVVVIAFLAVKVRYEEKLLLDRYPDYAAYRQRTWGLFPGLR